MKQAIYDAIANENVAQLKKWGVQNHSPEYWLGILMEEVGEAAKDCIEYEYDLLEIELIQVAAVAAAFVDYLQREKKANGEEKDN